MPEADPAARERIAAIFAAAGYTHVEPAILQPADLFFDRVGEDIRARTYIVTDPEGRELCLRPDLTLPVCQHHLDSGSGVPARYRYDGLAFRFQPMGTQPPRPHEFPQSGLECLGVADRDTADAEVLALVSSAVAATHRGGTRLRLGDVGLYAALLAALPMPARWRRRLQRAFWRPRRMASLLATLTGRPVAALNADVARLAHELLRAPDAERAAVLVAHWETADIAPAGHRAPAAIAARLAEQAADATEQPLSEQTAEVIRRYLAIADAPDKALRAIADLAREAGIDLAAALERQGAQQARFAATGALPDATVFETQFGRQFEYYTGIVFQLEPAAGPAVPLAGGGRYDTLLSAMGAPEPVAAVGAAVHTARLVT